jgi:hypothetical protein
VSRLTIGHEHLEPGIAASALNAAAPCQGSQPLGMHAGRPSGLGHGQPLVGRSVDRHADRDRVAGIGGS